MVPGRTYLDFNGVTYMVNGPLLQPPMSAAWLHRLLQPQAARSGSGVGAQGSAAQTMMGVSTRRRPSSRRSVPCS